MMCLFRSIMTRDTEYTSHVQFGIPYKTVHTRVDTKAIHSFRIFKAAQKQPPYFLIFWGGMWGGGGRAGD